MTDDTLLAFTLPAVNGKKVIEDIEVGPMSLNSGLDPLRVTERRRGLAAVLAGSEDAVGCSAVQTAAAPAWRRCARSSAPPSSTTSIRSPGSPMSSAASPGRRRAGSMNSCPGTRKSASDKIGLRRPRPPTGASSPEKPHHQTQPEIPRGLRRMLTPILRHVVRLASSSTVNVRSKKDCLCHLLVAAESVGQPHLLRRAAFRLEQRRVCHKHAGATGT